MDNILYAELWTVKDKKGRLTQLNPVRWDSLIKQFNLIPRDTFGDKHLASPSYILLWCVAQLSGDSLKTLGEEYKHEILENFNDISWVYSVWSLAAKNICTSYINGLLFLTNISGM